MQHFKTANFYKQETLSSQNGIIQGVVIVKQGIDKDGGYFTPEFMQSLVAQANEQTKGVKCRFGHPNMCKTTLGSFIGRYKKFRIEEDKVLADLHLAEIAKQTQVEGRGISIWDYVTEMAKSEDDAFGNSIHFTGGISYEEKEVNGETREVEVYEFGSLIASDLVDSPAATESLFKDSSDLGLMVTDFLDANPDIFKAVEDNPSVIDEFFNKYKFYKKSRKMNIIKKVKEKLGIQKDIEQTLADGTVATVVTDAEQPQVGDAVVDESGSPIADGEQVLPDGSKWIIEGGKIAEIVAPEESTEEIETEESVNTEDFEKSQKELRKAKKTISKQEKRIEDLEKVVELLADDITTLRKSVKSSFKFEKKNGGSAPYQKESEKGSFYDRVIKNRKKEE